MWRNNTVVGDIALMWRIKGVITLYLDIYLCRKRNTIYNTYQEKDIWKSIVTLIYREVPALGRKIDIFKLIYRYLLAFGR